MCALCSNFISQSKPYSHLRHEEHKVQFFSHARGKKQKNLVNRANNLLAICNTLDCYFNRENFLT